METKRNEAEWTQRAKPNEGERRERRLSISFTQTMADRLRLLSIMDRISVNHELEILVDAEYKKRLKNPAAKVFLESIEKLNATATE